MGYNIDLYRREVKEKEIELAIEDFFEHDEFLLPFTAEQRQGLHERLLRYGYVVAGGISSHTEYTIPDHPSILVTLMDCGLFFQLSGADEEAFFEAGMTASEFTDTGEFAKYDLQNGGWEEEF